jgi:AcrR family transcriptional regulator
VQIRDDIVTAAAQLFGECGYERATLDDLAQALGMKKGSLYYHIRSKEDLLFAVHDRLIDELAENTRRALAQADGVAEQLRAALQAAMRLIAEHQQEVTVFLHERHIFNSQRWATIRAKRRHYEESVSGVLKAGMADGTFRQLPVPLATIGVLGMVNWGYQWFHRDGPYTADEIADVFADLVLGGLLATPDPTPPRSRTRAKEQR